MEYQNVTAQKESTPDKSIEDVAAVQMQNGESIENSDRGELRVFMSYRRDDTQAITGRIYDKLVTALGTEQVFIDIDGIPLGVDFRQHLSNEMARSNVFVAIVGNQWLGEDINDRRIDSPIDFVRLEVEAALKMDIPVIPLLVGGASMPSSAQLPDDIKGFAYRHGTVIDQGGDFHLHMDRFISALQGLSH